MLEFCMWLVIALLSVTVGGLLHRCVRAERLAGSWKQRFRGLERDFDGASKASFRAYGEAAALRKALKVVEMGGRLQERHFCAYPDCYNPWAGCDKHTQEDIDRREKDDYW